MGRSGIRPYQISDMSEEDGGHGKTIFERRWASTLLDQVADRLREDYRASGRSELFEGLRGCLSGDKGQIPFAELGAGLGMTEGAVKVAVHRLRKRSGELLRAEIANTVASPVEIEDEIRHFIAVLSQ